MPILLSDARTLLTDSILHVGSASITDEQKDEALYAAGSEFVRETQCLTDSTNITVAINTNSVDVTATITDFTRDRFNRAEIDFYNVGLTDYEALRQANEGDNAVKGRPTLCAFLTDDFMLFNKKALQAYTMKLTHREPMTEWTIGTADVTTLNLPDEWVKQVIWMGAKAYLLRGAPGFPDATVAEQRFAALIEQAKMHFAPLTPGVRDRQTHPGVR
jgi:hypothetical protein